MLNLRLPSLAVLLVLAGNAFAPAATPAVRTHPVKGANLTGIDLSAMDRTLAPGDDFYGFANGAWAQRTVIPADRGSYGLGTEVNERTNQRIADLIKNVATGKTKPSVEATKIRDFYSSFMDEAGIETRGLKVLQPALERIVRISNRKELSQILGDSLRADVDVLNATNLTTRNLLGLWVAQDLNDPSRYVPFLVQGGLSLPDRDFYLSPAPSMETIRAKYLTHIATVLKLAKISDPEGKAARIFQLERRMAEAHSSRSETGDVKKGNNPWTRADFDTKAPGLDWETYFTAAGLKGQKNFVVWQPNALIGLSALAGSESVDTWKDYLTFMALDKHASVLPRAFAEESFAFYGQAMQGVPQQRARAKRGIDATSDALGEIVGKLYVQHHFPAADKARVQAMVTNILKAFERRIEGLEWMAATTKAKAKAKLAVMKVGVGYPDKWVDYSKLAIDAKDIIGNLERIERFETARNLRKLGSPIDRSEWVMTPQVVNAVNLPALNAMNFPAGMLQPPYFDPQQPEAMNYGAIGAIIGHEVSHSFDDQGALFDSTGKLNNWWTPEDMAHFQASAAKLVTQYNGYHPLPDVPVNGQLTLGENIADVAGLAVSLDAFHLSLKKGAAPKVQGFSGDQQFFLSYAQSWREKTRELVLRQQLLTDGHTPAEYRTYTVRNLDAWYEAFSVKPGQKLHLEPKDRVRIW